MSNPVEVPGVNSDQMPSGWRITDGLRWVSLVLATGFPALAFFRVGQISLALFCLALGGLWAIGFYRKVGLIGTFAQVGFVGAAVYGLVLGLSPFWILAAILSVLAAWDLDGFSQRLRQVEGAEMLLRLERAHLRQLALVTGASLLITGIILSLHFRLPFAIVILLGLLAVYGLAQLVSFLRRESD